METKQKEIMQYAVRFEAALHDVLTNEENEFYVEIENEDITDVMTGLCLGFLNLVRKLTRTKGNFLDHISMVNKIIVQYLMKYGKVE